MGPTGTGYSGHVPDVPGVIATGRTIKEALARLKAGVEQFFKLSRVEGEEIPVPSTITATIEVDVA